MECHWVPKPYSRPDPMPSYRWSTQDKLNGILRLFWSHYVLSGNILLFFCLCIMVSNFVVLLGVHVFLVLFLFNLFYCCILVWFLIACLFSKERMKMWSWIGREVGRTWEEIRRRNCDQNMLYENLFSVKKKEIRSLEQSPLPLPIFYLQDITLFCLSILSLFISLSLWHLNHKNCRGWNFFITFS